MPIVNHGLRPWLKLYRRSAAMKQMAKLQLRAIARVTLSRREKALSLRIGVDTGGTFTDFVVIRHGEVEIFKELSTPQQPDQAIMKGIRRVEGEPAREIIHGSTVATNA